MKRKQIAILGMFVIMGLITIIATAIYFVPRLSLDLTKSYVIYFEGPLTGLHVGSPVNIRGIKVGQVSRFELKYIRKTKSFNVPIYINFYRRSSGELANHELINRLIQQGLRGELHVENMLTGNASIEIEFRPGIKGYVPKERVSTATVIPSVPDDQKPADLNSAISAAKDMFDSIKQLATSDKVGNTFTSVTQAANKLKALSVSINNQVPVVSSNLNDSLSQINRTAYSVGNLSEYLSRHPESLIKGKQSSARR